VTVVMATMPAAVAAAATATTAAAAALPTSTVLIGPSRFLVRARLCRATVQFAGTCEQE
jgi:hypothetical protein